MEAELRSFLAENFLLGEEFRGLPGSASLIEAGIIDSTGVLELVGFLEEAYEIEITDSELVPENLDSIDQVVRFVGAKRNSGHTK
ncbi:MAG: acyl carrier protein [Gaiellaceae bacterium]